MTLSQAGEAFKRLADAAHDNSVSPEEFERALEKFRVAWPAMTDDDIALIRRRFGSWWLARTIFHDNIFQAVARCWYHEWSMEDLRHAARER